MKIYDLSCTLDENTWFYGSPYKKFNMKEIATIEKNGYIARELNMTAHLGTHMECEAHWDEKGTSADEIPLERFAGKARVLRFPTGGAPLFEINENEIIKAGGENLEAGDIVILSTEWDKKYVGNDFVFESPYISVDGAKYLTSKNVKLVAFDFPMCGDPRDGMDYVPEGTELPDRIFFDNDVPIIVGLESVDKIPDEVFFAAFPLKVKGCDGSPVRAVAVELRKQGPME